MTTGASERPGYRLGIDIGGTFTDFNLLDARNGEVFAFKTPTVPRDPSKGVANGLRVLAEQGVAMDGIDYFVHGTTIALNSVIQRTGARVALLVTEGFRDILELARLRLPVPWNFYSQRPKPLIPRELVLPVRERLRFGGVVETELSSREVDRVVDEIEHLGVDGVAICLLHAFSNPVHEEMLRDALLDRDPTMFVSTSAEVWPQAREYERALVTVINTYIRPRMVGYVDRLHGVLNEAGVEARPYLTRSNGGIMTTTAARDEAVQTLLSGPASGVIGAAAVAARAGFSNALTLDMGGTSADVAVVQDGGVAYSREEHVGDFPVIVPSIAISSIGAGGGSVAWVDGAGVLKVGPKSAGADPGPACYALGGTEPTVTDAFLVSGYLNASRFAGKTMLSADAAKEALDILAGPLRLDDRQVAQAIIRVTIANMFTEFSAVLERKGLDPRDFTLIAFGGAGPVIACLLAEEIGIPRVLVPLAPGTLCALGAISAQVMADFVRSIDRPLSRAGDIDLKAEIAPLRRRAAEWLTREAPATAVTHFLTSADLRYVGQSHEVEISLDDAWLDTGGEGRIAEAFHAEHDRLFAHSEPGADVELINLRVRAVGELPGVGGGELAASSTAAPIPATTRTIHEFAGAVAASVYEREALLPRQEFDGPAIVEQADSTVIVPTGWRASVDPYLNLIVTSECG